MKVAIIGAGFAGLSSAWHLLKNSHPLEITIFDHLGIGGGASGIAAGLLHPFGGLHSKLNRFGLEGMESTLKLLETSQKALKNETHVNSGLLRLATTTSKEEDYQKCALLNEGVNFLSKEECQNFLTQIAPFPGILIDQAKTIYTEKYLEGLFLELKTLGVKFEKVKIDHLDELKAFDRVVVTAGIDTKSFDELKHLEIFSVKGQILELEWPNYLEPLKLPVNSESYIVMSQDKKSCIVGATFEKQFSSVIPDVSFAKSYIMPKALELIPQLQEAKIINCRAAIRVSTKDHLPIVKKINERLFVFTGLGSKGLLYHSFYAEKLQQLMNT